MPKTNKILKYHWKIIILKIIFIPKTILSGLQNIYWNSKINFELIIMENRLERWK